MSRSYHDKKPFGSPPKWFKQMQKSRRKAKERQALRTDQDIPTFKQSDKWDWN